jgi:hypothetical protein
MTQKRHVLIGGPLRSTLSLREAPPYRSAAPKARQIGGPFHVEAVPMLRAPGRYRYRVVGETPRRRAIYVTVMSGPANSALAC